MTNEEIVAKAKKLTAELQQPFTMATVSKDGKPSIRWMGALVLEEPFAVYMVTYRGSRKVQHIQGNPNIQLLLARQDFSEQVALIGTAGVDDSADKKKEIWEKIPAAREYFKGPDDPAFLVLKMAVRQVELWTSQNQREPLTAIV